MGRRLDLGWRALPDSRQVKTVLQAETKIRVEPTEESILLKARQLVEPLQGSVKEFEVTLPSGFSVVELKVDGERYRPLDSFPQPPEPVKIALPAATTNRVQVGLDFASPLARVGATDCGRLQRQRDAEAIGRDGQRQRDAPAIGRDRHRRI